MAFLNPLGANVRNHMSTIEDKFVDQARQVFPVAAKLAKAATITKNPENQNIESKTETVKPNSLEKPVVSDPVSTRKVTSAIKQTVSTPDVNTAPKKAESQQNITPQRSGQPEKSGQRATQPNRGTEGSRVVPPVSQPRSSGNTQDRTAVSNQALPTVQGNSTDGLKRPIDPIKQVANGPGNQTPRYNSPPNQNRFAPGQRPAPTTGSRSTQGMGQRPAPTTGQRPSTSMGQRPGPNSGPNSGQRPSQGFSQRPNQGSSGQRPSQGAGQRSGSSSGQRPNQGASQRPGPSSGQRPGQGFGQRPGQGGSGQRPGQYGSRGGAHSPNNFNNRGGQGRTQVGHQQAPAKTQGPVTSVKSIQLPDFMSIKNFSQLVELPASDIIKKLIGLGVMATINQEIDRDTMILIADEYGITATAAKTEAEKLQVTEIEDDPNSLIHRPPVVTILGHVDHGKTSLLDAIRETNVTAQEAGGITQHIGAYQVELKERKITFLDTPGHAAFTAMRARGALVTDIAILVVAADDGVMPQTIEAINHVQDANVPIIVAINKIDKAGANLERIKTDLMQYGLVDEDLGGETIFVPVSAKKRTGIETLLEMILLMADVKDFKANPNRMAKGTVIEAKLDKGSGPIATVLVQHGTLQVGDTIIAGAAMGKVKVLKNDKGKRIKKAGPSTPVEVIGFNEVPEAGDTLHVATEDRSTRELADKRMQYKRETELKKNQKVTLDDLFTKIKEGEIKDLKLIIKADVQGSIEAIRKSLEQLSTEEVRVKVIQGAVGGIGEGDVMLASASNAIIIGFNVRPDPIAKRIAEKESVDLRLYRVIYNIIEDVQKAMEGMLDPTFKEVINGKAEIRQVYKVPKAGNVGGCYVMEGKISRNSDIRLIRDNIVILEGKIDSLKRFKDDAREVLEGFECGIGIEKYNDIKEGDIIEAFSMEEVKRTIAK